MGTVRNVLFIMCDQLRADYLSCAGHPSLKTPNIDALAARGVRFAHSYVQAPVCGPSRMSFYTGRYSASHGAFWNFVPLPVGEMMLGDLLRPLDMRIALAGKTHHFADKAGMSRLGIEPDSAAGRGLLAGGFDNVVRDDGIHPAAAGRIESDYAKFLRANGFDSDNPWHDFANSAADADGNVLSGWNMRNCGLPAVVPDEMGETAYMTDRALDFIAEQGDDPWCLHLSYIKPHWPYIVSAPYHDLYGVGDILSAVRSAEERDTDHEVIQAFMARSEGREFQRDEVRETVIPAYMGLITQVDTHLGRVFEALDKAGRFDDTMIIFTSDHGDYLGDHWLGEKEMYHEQSSRIPLIVYDPDGAADGTRGTVDNRFAEAIDVVSTILDAVGLEVPDNIVEGRSLVPLLRGEDPDDWRDAVFSELDYAFYSDVRDPLERPIDQCRTFMVREGRWKYIAYEGYRAQLFDLEADPEELQDLGDDPAHEAERVRLHRRLADWQSGLKYRVTAPESFVREFKVKEGKSGVLIGNW